MNRRLQWTDLVGLAVSGLAIGWLCGLSVSPVLQVVIASLLTGIAAVTAALSGVEPAKSESPELTRRNLRPRVIPLAVLIIFLAFGACAGVYARTRNWLGEDLASEAQRWAKTGYDEQTIYRRLFDREAPARPRSSSSESKESGHTPASSDAWKQGVLFSSVPQDRCKELRNVSDDRLSTNLTLLNDSRVTHFVATGPTPKILRAFVKEVLCPAE